MNKYFAGNYDISGNGSIGAEDHPTGAGDVGNIIGGADTTRTFDDLKFEYDFARQAMRITQTGDDTIHLTSDTAITGELFGAHNLRNFISVLRQASQSHRDHCSKHSSSACFC